MFAEYTHVIVTIRAKTLAGTHIVNSWLLWLSRSSKNLPKRERFKGSGWEDDSGCDEDGTDIALLKLDLS